MKRHFTRGGMPLLVLFASLALLVGCVGFVYARPNPQPGPQPRQLPSRQDDQLARDSINRTNQVLQDAQNSVRSRRHYTGNLASAYSNQQYARELYDRSAYHSAIEYTLYARQLAYQALDANGPRYSRNRYADENQFHSRSKAQLNDERRRAHPDGPTDDQAVLSLSFGFNL
jgi:hypothetical protein